MSDPTRGGRPKGKIDRWQQWQKTHRINYPSLSPSERQRVRELYLRETGGTRTAGPQQAPKPVPEPTTTGTAPLPEHLAKLGATTTPTPPKEPTPPPLQALGVAPSQVFGTLWEMVYRGRSYFQYYPMVRGYVSLNMVEAIWNLSDDQAATVGEATANAWEKYVPKNHPANIALQQAWPMLALGASLLMVEKAKQEEWAALIHVLQHGPAVPAGQPETGPLEPVTSGASPPQSASPNPWETLVREGGGAPISSVSPTNGHAPQEQPTVSYVEELRRAGAVTEPVPPPGVGLRQAMTKSIGPAT